MKVRGEIINVMGGVWEAVCDVSAFSFANATYDVNGVETSGVFRLSDVWASSFVAALCVNAWYVNGDVTCGIV